ncbi:MAG: LD-carboxypeptidase [Bacteroidales bacterium]|jgi:muramoyltetrapeptide carboxypeptidase|nr:LD-carboxypeptidase [Bacteroidales bacterium]
MAKRPAFLKTKDKVAIVATARKASYEEVLPLKKLLESWGLEVVLGDTINTKAEFQLADTDENRAKDIQRFLDDTEIASIFVARGGYGTVRIIDLLDFSIFSQYPKWIVGYSDITVLLSHIYFNFNIQSLHATMGINISNNTSENTPSITSLKQCLFGEMKSIQWKSNTIMKKNLLNISYQRKKIVNGDIVCGNLSVLYSMLGSVSFGDTRGKILMLEDIDEYIYHIDRMFMALKRAGKLSDLAALIIGNFTDLKDNDTPFGKTVDEIVMEITKEYFYPVVFDCPFGHIVDKNTAIINGAKCILETDSAANHKLLYYNI